MEKYSQYVCYYVLPILISVGVILFGFNSCTNHDYEKVNDKGTSATAFEYKGHMYLEFKKSLRMYGFSVVHDPNCECFKK